MFSSFKHCLYSPQTCSRYFAESLKGGILTKVFTWSGQGWNLQIHIAATFVAQSMCRSARDSNPFSCNDHKPLDMIPLRKTELIRLVRESEIIFLPSIHRTCPLVRTKSPLRMLRSIAVRLSSMCADEFLHLVMVSYKDRESVTAINGTWRSWSSHVLSFISAPIVSHSINRCQ